MFSREATLILNAAKEAVCLKERSLGGIAVWKPSLSNAGSSAPCWKMVQTGGGQSMLREMLLICSVKRVIISSSQRKLRSVFRRSVPQPSTDEKHVPKGQTMSFIERSEPLEEWKCSGENPINFSSFPTKIARAARLWKSNLGTNRGRTVP